MLWINQLNNLKQKLETADLAHTKISGTVTGISKSVIECAGLQKYVAISSYAYVITSNRRIICQAVAIKDDKVLFLPFEDYSGVKVGDIVSLSHVEEYILPDLSWSSRVIDAFCCPKDNLGPLSQGKIKYFLHANAPNFDVRSTIGTKISLGVKVIDIFTPCCLGQRMGIFGGSGVGKSILTTILTKHAKADIKVIGFIGERSREINEFISSLSEEDIKNVIIIASSAEQSALIKKRAAYLTISIAEYFRDLGLEVLCVMDSLTRFAMAQRQISLSAGEIPVSKGYTTSVFSLLPKFLERAGPGPKGKGNITALFTVLVEGDDLNDPISDATRAILDGHIVLSRDIAEKNIFPAVDIFKSISRTAPNCYSQKENQIVQKAKSIIKTYEDMQDMIRLGIYKKGSNSKIDEAIDVYDKIQTFLNQDLYEVMSNQESFEELAKIINFT